MKNTSSVLIAKRYATALFQAAAAAKAQPAIIGQADALATALNDDTIRQALEGLGLTRNQRQQLAASLAKAVGAHPLLAGTLATMAANGRLSSVPAMLATLAELAQAAAGIVAVRVETATPLTDAQKIQLKVMLKTHTGSSNVALTEVHNPRLLGGFRAFFNGMVWEQSVRGRLARLAGSLLSNIHNSSYSAK